MRCRAKHGNGTLRSASPGAAAVIALLLVLAASCQSPRNVLPGELEGGGGAGGGAGSKATGGVPGAGLGGVGGAETDAGVSPSPDSAQDSACGAGQHICPIGCVENASPQSCGSACDPCPGVTGGTPVCDGTKCGVACPDGQKACLGACVDKNAACDGTCPAGKNPCAGVCVEATSVVSCGAGCLPCPTSANGAASCDGSKCNLACHTGYHRCGDACVSDTNANSCGGRCDPCPSSANQRATCVAGVCDFECASGFKCNNACHTCCIAAQCPAVAGRTASCPSFACQYTDNCTAGGACGHDTDCQTFHTTCPGGVAQCTPSNRSNDTACGTGASAGTCQNGTCISACAGVDCHGHGSCIAGVGTCQCTGGYSGSFCTTAPDLCAGNTCNNHGTCNPGDGRCVCSGGWTSPANGCTTAPDLCAGKSCNGNGTCNASTGFCITGRAGNGYTLGGDRVTGTWAYVLMTGAKKTYNNFEQGDFYVSDGDGFSKFWANNTGMNGIQRVGSSANLASVMVPPDNYQFQGVDVATGGTYASIARDPDKRFYIVLHVTSKGPPIVFDWIIVYQPQ